MKKFLFPLLATSLSLLSISAFSQDKKDKAKTPNPAVDTTELLGLPGDNLDLYAVLDIFQKSKTIEAFEKSLNEEKTKINNLDLDLDKKIDFIKVVTKKKDSSFQFVLQVDVSKTETQDVAVILVDKVKGGKVSIQIVGDEDLYGKDYVIEPKGNSSITSNPGYTGENPVTVNVPASTTTVVVQSPPIVQYVYSPAYVPYAPPYYYGYYPPYFAFATVIAVGIYRSNHWGYHGGYYGGHYGGHNTVIINNNNNFNNYNNNKMRSNTVADNKAKGNYGSGSANRRGGGPSASTQPAGGRGQGGAGGGPSASTRPSNSSPNRGSSPSVSNNRQPSASPSTRQSSNYSSPSRSSSMSSGRSMGGGGMSRGGGGGRRR